MLKLGDFITEQMFIDGFEEWKEDESVKIILEGFEMMKWRKEVEIITMNAYLAGTMVMAKMFESGLIKLNQEMRRDKNDGE